MVKEPKKFRLKDKHRYNTSMHTLPTLQSNSLPVRETLQKSHFPHFQAAGFPLACILNILRATSQQFSNPKIHVYTSVSIQRLRGWRRRRVGGGRRSSLSPTRFYSAPLVCAVDCLCRTGVEVKRSIKNANSTNWDIKRHIALVVEEISGLMAWRHSPLNLRLKSFNFCQVRRG